MDHCLLSWDSFKKNVCEGFSRLQQREEFVDMTLAADGHLVKVHRNLIALASPYIREMIQSTSCQHPVLFLSNVSHETLSYLLEYIYTGEVRVPTCNITKLVTAAKALHIRGLEDIIPPAQVSNSKMDSANPAPQERDDTQRWTSISKVLLPDNESAMSESQILNNNNDANQDMSELIQPKPNQEEYLDYDTEIQTFDVVNDVSGLIQPKSKQDDDDIEIQTFDVVGDAMQQSGDINGIDLNEATGTSETTSKIVDIAQANCNFDDNMINDTSVQCGNGYSFKINNSSSENGMRIISISTVDEGRTMPENNAEIKPSISNTNAVIMVIPNDVDMEPRSDELQGSTINKQEMYPKITILSVSSGDGTVSLSTELSTMPGIEGQSKQTDLYGATPLYMLSNKGMIQLIMNRYMYNRHHASSCGRKRRWRCIDYRHKGCKALIDTVGEMIVNRLFTHSHTFHDEQIMKKGTRNLMFTSIEAVENVQKENNMK